MHAAQGSAAVKRPNLLVVAIAVVLLIVIALLLLRAGERTAPSATGPAADLRRDVPLVTTADPAASPSAEERTPLALATATTPDAEPAEAQEPSLLHGQVVDEHRQPVPGAEVALVVRPAGEFATLIDHDYLDEERRIAAVTTGESGTFRFEVEPARTYGLRVRATGWCEAQAGDVGAGPALEIVLARGADLSVRAVRASDGAPIANARVVVMHVAIAVNPELRTDAAGKARFLALPPGDAWVQAMPEVEISRGLDVELVAGQDKELLFELGDGHAIVGTVRERGSGRPIAGAEVSSWSFYAKTVRTDSLGHYRIAGVDPGGVDFRTVSARAPGFGRASRRVVLTTGTEPICDFELVRGFSVRGRVVMTDGTPIGGAYVAATAAFEQGKSMNDHVASRSAADGKFEIADATPEESHVLFLRAHAHETRIVDVPSPAPETAVTDVGDVVLAAGAGIEGRVATGSGDPIEGALLVLQYAGSATFSRNQGLHMQNMRTDIHGRFRATDLAAGRHEIRVVFAGYSDLRSEVDLRAGEVRRGLELVLAGGGVLAGLVVDADGAGVGNAEVDVTGPDSLRWIGRCRSADDGSFRIEGLPDELVKIGAQRFEPLERPGGEVVRYLPSADVEVRPWTTDLRILLPTAGVIEGRILASDGAALVGGCVEAFDADGRVVGDAPGREGRFQLLVPAGATVRLVGYRRTLSETGRFQRVPMPGEEAVVEGVRAGARDVVVRFARRP